MCIRDRHGGVRQGGAVPRLVKGGFRQHLKGGQGLIKLIKVHVFQVVVRRGGFLHRRTLLGGHLFHEIEKSHGAGSIVLGNLFQRFLVFGFQYIDILFLDQGIFPLIGCLLYTSGTPRTKFSLERTWLPAFKLKSFAQAFSRLRRARRALGFL